MKTALRLLLAPYRFSVDRLFRMGEIGGAHWFTDPNTLYRRRNRLTYTRDFSNAAWTRTNILSVTSDADGVGDLVVPNTTPSTHAINQQSAVTVGATTTYVVRAKPGGYDFVILSLGGSSLAYFDVSAGTVGTATNAISTSIAAAADAPGYYDCTLVAIPTSANCFVYAAQTNGVASFAGDGTSGVYLARAQLETYTTTATEYQDVPTTWAQAYLAAVGAENIFAWTDNAGTTPVTAVGDTIGLSLDRAYGGRTDGSLIASGATGLTGTATAASYDTSTGAGSVSRAGDASNQSWVSWTGLTTSAIHRIRITNTGATSLDLRNGGVAGTIVASIAAGATSYVHPLTSGGSTSITITATNNSTTATFTVLEFGRVPGTHLIQATGTARPTLSARVNALLNTETLGGTGWSANGGATSLSGQTAPDGTSTAVRITSTAVVNSGYNQSGLTAHGGQQREGIWLRGVSGGEAVSFGDATNRTNVVLTTSWAYYTGTATKASAFFVVYANGAVAQSWFAWHPDSRTADDAAKNIPVYQRVGATAADHDTDGFPHGQYPDGTDDNQTTTTGGGGTTGFFYCGAITVSGGAGTARAIWSDTGTNTGYRVRVNSSNKLELAAGNGSAYTTVESNETITAPGTYILSAWDDGGVLAVQVNNFAAATTTRPSVSAGTSTATMYKDNGAASSYLNGRDYGSVYRQSYPGESQHAQLKRWLKNVARLP